MNNLQLDQTYYYRVGNGVDSWSKVFQYKVLSPLQDITFAVLGDIDFEANTTIANIATLAQAGDIQGVLITGDISYADGYEPHWDRFFERAEVFAG
jgi:phosphodiesterase/alkaline phosphatase D-like protein